MRPQFALTAALVAVGTFLAVGHSLALSDDAPLSASDKKFVMEAAMGGMMEVKLGEVAAQHGGHASVKQFGERMVRDHSKVNGELAKFAASHAVALPKELDAQHQRMVEKLSKLSGNEFDEAYMKDMVQDHEKDVAAFAKQAEKGDNADLKAWAGKTLPGLKEHLQLARDVAKEVGVNVATR